MAITTTTIEIANGNTGWARSDIIIGIQSAFAWLGFLDEVSDAGIATGLSQRSGGGTVTGSNSTYENVVQISSSGIGTGASFNVYRSNGNIYSVRVNSPGYGYTTGEVVTVSSESIGGSSNGATNLTLTIITDGGTISYGSSTAFYDSDLSGSFPWGVGRFVIDPTKKYGKTYHAFQTYSNTNLALFSGSGFFPYNGTANTSDLRAGWPNRFTGQNGLDLGYDPVSSGVYFDSADANQHRYYAKGGFTGGLQYANSSSYKLDLNIFRSSLDPNFAVLSFKHPTLSSGKLRDNTYLTFFIHNYSSNIWDLDYQFLDGITYIEPSTNDSYPYIRFTSMFGGNQYYYSSLNAYTAKRAAESGYLGKNNSNTPYLQCDYHSTLYSGSAIYQNDVRFYSRRSGEGIDSSQNFNAVIKGIPLNLNLIPVPYYLPDDFVLIDFRYEAPSANIQQGDTITVSGSEVYTVIQGSYNQTGVTRGVLFCARTV
jgi:hypothetical protein